MSDNSGVGGAKKLVFKKRSTSSNNSNSDLVDNQSNQGNQGSDSEKKSPLIKLSKKIVDPAIKTPAPRKKASGSNNSDNTPLIFIDTSYFIFYRYHATKAWYLHSKKDEDADDLTIENEGFVENYSKHFRQWTAKISKKFKTPESKFFWFRDSPKEEVWRTPLFPAYKATRDEKCPDGIEGFFAYTYDNLIPVERQMLVPCAEADDVAAIAAKLENVNNPTQPIVIITADTDYLQLVNSVTRVVKLPNFDDIPVVVKIGKDKVTVTPNEYLLIKVLLGDSCDEISKVYAGCGPSTALNISRNPDEFTRLIENHPDRFAKYQLNLTLISFNEIPESIRTKCQAAYMAVRSL